MKQIIIGLLRELSKGHEVTTIGNSAGGFMATLVGEAIQATHCLSFSGQFHLGNANGKFMDIYMGEIKKDKILYRIKQSNVPIYFFYSNRNQSDVFYLFSGGWKTNVVMFVDKILDKSRYKSGNKKSERNCMVDI
ncbi:MAG: hypothetical protein R3Y54_13745 [Eubacteriales bacterium]